MLYYQGAAVWVQALRIALFLYPPFNMAQAFCRHCRQGVLDARPRRRHAQAGPGFHWQRPVCREGSCRTCSASTSSCRCRLSVVRAAGRQLCHLPAAGAADRRLLSQRRLDRHSLLAPPTRRRWRLAATRSSTQRRPVGARRDRRTPPSAWIPRCATASTCSTSARRTRRCCKGRRRRRAGRDAVV
jgi:hypothetical protein